MSHPKHASGGPDRARVLFVAGTGRSGSTVVSNLIGSVPGAVSVGELRYLWERGVGEKALCGCGAVFPDCPFWARVLNRAYPDGPPDVSEVRRAERELLRLRALPRLLLAHGEPADLGAGSRWYAGQLAKVYGAV